VNWTKQGWRENCLEWASPATYSSAGLWHCKQQLHVLLVGKCLLVSPLASARCKCRSKLIDGYTSPHYESHIFCYLDMNMHVNWLGQICQEEWAVPPPSSPFWIFWKRGAIKNVSLTYISQCNYTNTPLATQSLLFWSLLCNKLHPMHPHFSAAMALYLLVSLLLVASHFCSSGESFMVGDNCEWSIPVNEGTQILCSSAHLIWARQYQ
jgi:hypothetical protein